MGVPFLQQVRGGAYIVRQRVTGRERYPQELRWAANPMDAWRDRAFDAMLNDLIVVALIRRDRISADQMRQPTAR